MEKIREHKTIILIVGIILFSVLALAGLTYAWFSATVIGNEEAKNNVVETGELSIVYTNGEEIRGENIVPGWSETKTFTVENTGTATASYKINWENLTNEFVNKEGLVYTITGDNGKSINESQIPESGEHINIIDNISIEPGEVHTYSMTVKYINRDENQNEDMGKRLVGKIEVVDINGKVGEIATEAIINKYTENNTEGLIKIEQPATSQTSALTEYRYTGKTPKNYITFNNELWRIIGVFEVDDGSGQYEQRIKIIRDASIGGRAWNSSRNNDWSNADLKTYLNGEYYNGLSEESRNMIGESKWYTAAITYEQTTPNAYRNERGTTTSSGGYNWTGKIALMYPSDHGYASSSCYNSSTTLLYYSNSTCTNSNWLYNNANQWTLAPNSDPDLVSHVLRVESYGNLNTSYVSFSYGVRPVTYLISSVKITGGNGTSSSPYELFL